MSLSTLVNLGETDQFKELIEGLKKYQTHALKVQSGDEARVAKNTMLKCMTAISPAPTIQILLDEAEEEVKTRGGTAVYQNVIDAAQGVDEEETEEAEE